MTLKNLYDAIGASYDDTIERLMSADFLLRFVRKFPDDPSFAALKDALARGSTEEAFPGSTHPQGRVRQPGLHPAPGNRRTADGAAARRDLGGYGALVFKAQQGICPPAWANCTAGLRQPL